MVSTPPCLQISGSGTNSSSFLIGVRSGAYRGPRRDPNPFFFSSRIALATEVLLMCALALQALLWNMFLGDHWLLASRQNLNPQDPGPL